MGAAVAAETNSQETNIVSSQENNVSNSQIIVIEDGDDIEITGPIGECLGGVIIVNGLPVLCLTAASGIPLGPLGS
jgi:hypothetical protein